MNTLYFDFLNKVDDVYKITDVKEVANFVFLFLEGYVGFGVLNWSCFFWVHRYCERLF